MYSDIGNVGDGHTTCDPAFVLPERYAERSAIQLAPLEDVLGTDLQIFMLKVRMTFPTRAWVLDAGWALSDWRPSQQIDVEGYEYDVMRTAKRLLKVCVRAALATSTMS
jgi:hypothetical protein